MRSTREGARRRGRRREGGVVATEFALIAPILITLVFGIIDFGFVFNAQIALTQAAREGVRVGAIGDNPNETLMEDRFRASFSALGAGVPAVAAAACDAGDTENEATLTATLPFETPMARFGPFTLSSTAVMRCGG